MSQSAQSFASTTHDRLLALRAEVEAEHEARSAGGDLPPTPLLDSLEGRATQQEPAQEGRADEQAQAAEPTVNEEALSLFTAEALAASRLRQIRRELDRENNQQRIADAKRRTASSRAGQHEASTPPPPTAGEWVPPQVRFERELLARREALVAKEQAGWAQLGRINERAAGINRQPNPRNPSGGSTSGLSFARLLRVALIVYAVVVVGTVAVLADFVAPTLGIEPTDSEAEPEPTTTCEQVGIDPALSVGDDGRLFRWITPVEPLVRCLGQEGQRFHS